MIFRFMYVTVTVFDHSFVNGYGKGKAVTVSYIFERSSVNVIDLSNGS